MCTLFLCLYVYIFSCVIDKLHLYMLVLYIYRHKAIFIKLINEQVQTKTEERRYNSQNTQHRKHINFLWNKSI